MKKDKISNFEKDIFKELMNRYEFLIDEVDVDGKKVFVGMKSIKENTVYAVVVSLEKQSRTIANEVKKYFENQGFTVVLNTIVLLRDVKNEYKEIPENSILVDTQKKCLIGYEEISKPIVLALEDILRKPITKRKTLKEKLKEFNKSTPIATKCLMGINIWIFVITVIISFFINHQFISNFFNVDSRVLYIMGAKVNYLILEENQWWRVIAHMFLHGGIIHLLFNMYALALIGPAVEKLIGSVKFIFIYLLLGIGACIFSMKFTNGFSVGASGAIFGLVGIIFVLAYMNKKNNFRSQEIFKNIIGLIAINLFIGFSSTGIDNAAHIGGLAVGIGAGYFIVSKKLKSSLV